VVNPRVDQLEHQFVSLMVMFKAFIKKSDEWMERMDKKLDSLLSKKLLDEQKNGVSYP
jgi:hypothetical protein